MRKIFLLICCLLSFIANAQTARTIYSKSYGQRKDPVIIFIHGGPSGNSTLFEGTTAEKLANKGFYVIVYDRRGEGRSIDSTATFTYQEAIDDLNELYKTYSLKKANIIAHSFGGLIGTLFAAQNPDRVNSLILAGGLFSQQETYDHILKTTKEYYSEKKDSLSLQQIAEVQNLSKNSAEYRKRCYELASKNGYFTMPFPTAEADELREHFELGKFAGSNIRNNNAPIVFYRNEPRNNIDTQPILKNLKKQVKLFAIYGEQDRIFSERQLSNIEKIVGKQHFMIVENCSHFLFVDQQKIFINAVVGWLK